MSSNDYIQILKIWTMLPRGWHLSITSFYYWKMWYIRKESIIHSYWETIWFHTNLKFTYYVLAWAENTDKLKCFHMILVFWRKINILHDLICLMQTTIFTLVIINNVYNYCLHTNIVIIKYICLKRASIILNLSENKK